MVVFTCNHCGDSLQKPRVEKHYMIACRTAKSLTCMDCLKDFRGEDYVDHTKCVSETQRYGAKGSTIEEVKKGEAKQENWTTFIKDIIVKSPDVPINYLTYLQALSRLNNVPRTKDKFLKFMQNSGGRNPHKDLINGLWDFIEKHKEGKQEQNKESNQEEKSSSQPEKKKQNRQGNKQLNKQLKKLEIDTKNFNEPNDIDKDESNTENSSVQVKSKKRKSDAVNNKADEESCKKQKENEVDCELNNSVAEIKKEKKKKKKNSLVFENLNADTKMNEDVNNVQDKEINNSENIAQDQETREKRKNIEHDSSIQVKSKKKKSDIVNNKMDAEICKTQKENGFDNGLDNSTVEAKKKEKKKKKNSTYRNSNADTKINECVNDLKQVNNLDITAENGEILENLKISKKKNKKRNRASDFFTEAIEGVNNKDEKISDDENTLISNKNTNKKEKSENVDVEKEDSEVPKGDSNFPESFSLQDKILDILNSKSSISLNKLQKKVLKTYDKTDNARSEKKLLKKLNRTLKKLNNIEISNDIVKLMSV